VVILHLARRKKETAKEVTA